MFFLRGCSRRLIAGVLFGCVSVVCAAEFGAKSQIVEDLYDAHFVDRGHGWAVGVFGAVYRTEDGGKHWQLQETPTIQHLYSVTFLDEKTGYAVGRSGEIIRTADAGATWTRVQSGTKKHLFQVKFPTPDVGWVVGDWGVVLHTRDGGTSWQDRSLAEDQIVYAVDFADQQNGWMVGEFGSIRHTTDGGETWTLQNAGTQKTFFGVEAISPMKAWAVGIDGLVVRTQDGGQTWQIQNGQAEMATFENIGFLELLRNPGLYDVQIQGNTGYVVGDTGNVLVTLDGGETWTTEQLPAEWRLSWIRGLSVLSTGWGMVVGAQGLTFECEGKEMRFSQAES